MTKAQEHSPLIRLQAARRAKDAAEAACPHWDLNGFDFGEHGDPSECCYKLDEARRELKRAAAAIQPKQAGK